MKRLLSLALFLLFSSASRAADPPSPARLLDGIPIRALGPANMSGRICDVAVVESRPATIYVACASGGLWKTNNQGTTWTPIFDQQPVASIGAVAVAPSDPNVIWVGTGEANPRNSVSWGNGVYVSRDAGKTWTQRGLAETHHIGRIAVHPDQPHIAYVAALGHLWGPNQERGLFKTVDGGQTWQQVLFVNSDTGCVDVALDSRDPDTVYVATWQVRRDAFAGGNPAVMTGPGSGLHRSDDGGKTWTRLTQGLPDRPLGRCGLAVFRKDPRILYAVVQTDKTVSTTVGQPPRSAGDEPIGGVFRSTDKGRTWRKVNDLCPRPFYYGQIRIDPENDQRVYVLGIRLFVSEDGGKTFRDDAAAGTHNDHHALWIDPHNPEHLVLGNDGGLYFSHDRGAAWEHVKNLPLAQFYGIALDLRKPFRIFGGLQDNGTWVGPSATRNPEGITLADWSHLLRGDGFACQVDPNDSNTLYAEAQYGRLQRVNVGDGTAVSIRPTAAKTASEYRFNWNAPLLLSPHNARTVYFGGNHVFRSTNRGDRWEVISPDLTRGPPGPNGNTGHTLSALAESPVRAGLLYAGSDDGRVHVTRNGGTDWLERSDRVPGVPPDRWISRLECSHFAEGTAYLAIDRHRNDDRAPCLFKTTDYGATWQSLAADLPPGGPVLVVREDARNPDLLYVGTEFGLFVSLDGGRHWQRWRNGVPAVPVYDLALHPRDRELVVATHGRGLYVLDVAPLQELTPRVLDRDVYLCLIKPATVYQPRRPRQLSGGRLFTSPNPPFGATVVYYLKCTTTEAVRVVISDLAGKQLANLTGGRDAGLQRVTWDLGLPGERGELAAPGEYVARLLIGEREVGRRTFRVEAEE
jgi:photosystem II stability/assembly factor-like uncharacterized protein